MMFGHAFGSAPFGSIYLTKEPCGPLMKNSTAGEIEDTVRRETGRELDDSLTSEMFYDWINWSCDELKERLKLQNKYICKRSFGVGTSFDLSGISMGKIVKVVDSINGVATFLSPDGFERIGDFTGFTNSLFAHQRGETLELIYGDELTQGNVTVYYTRNVVPVVSRDSKPDLPDSYTRLLIEEVKRNLN